MAVIWGLDLKEMQWSKFGSSYMWNKEYHLRRTKFIVYQLAMILCVVSESLGTAALSDYVDQQDWIAQHRPGATVHNNNFVGIASYNIFVGIYVATIFGSAFFFDLFWPERKESKGVVLAWRICSVLACLFTLACALGYTVIVAMRSAYVTGTDAETAGRLLAEYGGSPMKYRKNGRAIASVVFLWPGTVATYASTFLLWHSLSHINEHGPKSSSFRTRDDLTANPAEKTTDNASEMTGATGSMLAGPEMAHHVQSGAHGGANDTTGMTVNMPAPSETAHSAQSGAHDGADDTTGAAGNKPAPSETPHHASTEMHDRNANANAEQTAV